MIMRDQYGDAEMTDLESSKDEDSDYYSENESVYTCNSCDRDSDEEL